MASSASDNLASVRETIYQAISSIRLIDPHTHINPHDPGSHTLADILGYHYYTELVHSAGMPRLEIEQPGITPRELVGRMVHGLGNITNTANYHWLIDICQTFFDFTDDAITPDNWEGLFDAAEAKMSSPAWPKTVLDRSNVESVFLTNDFDDALEGFDSNTYIPCLRTDDLVFHMAKPAVRKRLEACSGISLDGSLSTLEDALRQRFQHFVSRGARACAISIPPSFEPAIVSDGRAQTALDHVLQNGTASDSAHVNALSRRVFWTLAELCDEFNLPFDLMIGVNRGVYPSGVYQGQDLYDSRVSLIQYGELFNAFPKVKFPISVLASVTNQELVSYSWIFPNVLTNGHWWYSNTPSFIHRDAAARLEAVPRNKQIAYYSDAYKLEFVLPKFGMYRRILSRVLAEEFVGENGWSEEKAIELGRQVLRGNVDEVFPSPLGASEDSGTDSEQAIDPAPTVIVSEPDVQPTIETATIETATIETATIEALEEEQIIDPDETVDDVSELVSELTQPMTVDTDTSQSVIDEAALAATVEETVSTPSVPVVPSEVEPDSPVELVEDPAIGSAGLAAGVAGIAGVAGVAAHVFGDGADSIEETVSLEETVVLDNAPIQPSAAEPVEIVAEETAEEIAADEITASAEQIETASEVEAAGEAVAEIVDEWSQDEDLVLKETASDEPSELAAFLASDGDLDGDDEGTAGATIADDSDGTVGEDTIGPGLGTVADVEDTVAETAGDGLTFGSQILNPLPIDPLPTEHEVAGADVADVALDIQSNDHELTSLDAEIEGMPWNVGDLLGEVEPGAPAPFSPESAIQSLTGDGEFTPDSDSMVLEPDPKTGELHFPADGLDDTDEELPRVDDDEPDAGGFGAGVF